MAPGTDVLDDLDERGLIHDSTDRSQLDALLDEGPTTLYYGCDPTADSLHVGNLFGLLVLRRFQDAGHRPIALAGGATGMVGDPSGRSDERNLLDSATLERNVGRIEVQLAQFLDFETPGANRALLVDNRTWTEPISVLEFFRDVGKYVTVNQMIAKDSIRARFEGTAGISFTEFSYMLLQANDFAWLAEHEDCHLQIGGSDQWGNITAGIDLIRRRLGLTVHGLTWPLMTRADGAKFGKTADGAVWLAADRTSPYQFFQYWMQVDDADVERFLLQLTLLPVRECRAIAAAHELEPHRREGQRRLGREVTGLVHGADALAAAESASDILFGRPLEGADGAAFEVLAREVPGTEVARERLAGGMPIVDLLAESGLARSKGEVRKNPAGFSLNNERIDLDQIVTLDDLEAGRFLLLRKGKRSHHLVAAVE